MRYGYYANGFRFDSHLANFSFFFLYSFSGLIIIMLPSRGRVGFRDEVRVRVYLLALAIDTPVDLEIWKLINTPPAVT